MIDPSRTLTLRKKFERKLRVRFKLLLRDILEVIDTKDALGLKDDRELIFATTNAVVDVGAKAWSFLEDDRKMEEFEKWLEAETGLVIDPEGDVWSDFVQEGYEKGAGRAFDQVNKGAVARADSQLGLQFLGGQKQQFLTTALGSPESVNKVKLLARRTLTDLKGVNEVMATRIRTELLDGLVQGENPRTIGRRIATATGKARKNAERIARTEIIRAHSEGQLDALEELGVEEVGVQVEWQTAGDDRVCPICAGLSGKIFKIQNAHGRIPIHPNCRCAFVPVIP